MVKGLSYFMYISLLFIVGCGSGSEHQGGPLPADSWFTLNLGEKQIAAQLALTLPEKQKGLMHRKELGEDSAMLFPYTEPQAVSFYMKNTPLPLDLGLFDGAGILKEIHRLMPYDTTSIRSYSNEIQFALEMHQGWFARNSLFPGARLDLKSVAEAVERRGSDPRAYGLPTD